MFERNKGDDNSSKSIDLIKPSNASSKVIIGPGVKIKGEITEAREIQIDGDADVTMNTDHLLVGGTGNLKGNITSQNADIWGKLDGDIKIEGTLTIQEQGSVSGSIEYQNLQIKLGGQIKGDIKISEKVKKISEAKKEGPSLNDSSSGKNKANN
ncbi:MAG: hypothetical protein CFH19_01066 [Alphaproteobacteria bacterium MarineAlpha5_Bin9]|nr:MAG: hypothetical protein CFH19_01066 [Alphaproteobacteria bacterium MarineAlpha5_Bin9]|tara:strand:+ start:5830 stop:6291 length:462 start_codon:yes stop_codon:yes gene_type:complete